MSIDTFRSPRPVHNRIPALRADRGVTRQNLADSLGINYQTLGAIERGVYAPGLELALRICEFFQLPLERVFSRTPFRPMSQELAELAREGGPRS